MRYQCNPKTTVRAKMNSNGLVQACAVNRCADKVAITVTAAVSERDARWLRFLRTLLHIEVFFSRVSRARVRERGVGRLGEEGYGGYRDAISTQQREG